MRRAPAVLVPFAIALASAPAAHAEDKAACRDGFESGQSLRDAGKFGAAREKFLQCTRSCPAAFQAPCERWLSELDASQPTIVLRAVDESGQDLLDVAVTMDGSALTRRLDGKSLAVDPGPHALRFEAAGRAVVTKNVVVAAGEKNRVLLASMPGPRREAPPAAPREPPPVVAFVLAGAGALSLGGFAYFGLAGNAKHDDLVNGCSHTASCTQSDKDEVLRDWHVADALLVGGVVLLGVSAYLFLTHDARGPQASVGLSPAGGSLRVAF